MIQVKDESNSPGRNVLLIMGSVRAGRICPKVASWVARLGREYTDLGYEIVDLADWHLPMNDEPALPALGSYVQPHTVAWSEKVSRAAAVIFVTPQFNWGYPAVLKNAVDHLYAEWHGKPAAIVTYGGHGGTRCAKQLRQVAAAVKMNVVATAPAITLSEAVIRQNALLEPDRDFRPHRARLRRALEALADQINGSEGFLDGIRRKWKRFRAII